MILPIILILSFLTSAVFGEVAMDSGREKLLKDAVGWMTFRKNGNLMTDAELEPLFVTPVREKYVKSKFYRSFVIAFEQGVLPRLTLKEGDRCNPEYPKGFKDPFNNSVTWFYQKNFTFKMYDERTSAEKLCDYRQGLICKPTTSKCQCPEDSSMQPIEPGSPVKRCLLSVDKVCSLIDLDQEKDPKRSPLAANMYHLVFNLEKPVSCQPGSQCRIKDALTNYPKCYADTNGPFSSDSYVFDLGDECAIGLYASSSQCLSPAAHGDGLHPGYVCYNFGPPRSLKPGEPGYDTRIGFCAHEYGSYGITQTKGTFSGRVQFHPLFAPFITPRTVPLRGAQLRDFYARIYTASHWFFTGGSLGVQRDEGERCSVDQTKQWEDAWNYFAGLEKDPLPGKDYVEDATEGKLEDNLKSVEKLVERENNGLGGIPKKVCRVYSLVFRDYPTETYEREGFECVPTAPPDGDGNDGTCQTPGKVDTKDFAKKVRSLLDTVSQAGIESDHPEQFTRVDILRDFPEPPCDPTLGALPPTPSLKGRHHNPDTLEGGACPQGAVCYPDFSDAHELYPGKKEVYYGGDDDDNSRKCKLNSNFKQSLICHDTLEELGLCEKKHLGEKVDQILEDLGKYASLKLGETCYPEFEKAVLDWNPEAIEKMGYYQLISWLEKELLCDISNKLECGKGGTCEKCSKDECKDPEMPKKKREEEKKKKQKEKEMKTGKGGAEGVASVKITWMMSIVLAFIIIF